MARDTAANQPMAPIMHPRYFTRLKQGTCDQFRGSPASVRCSPPAGALESQPGLLMHAPLPRSQFQHAVLLKCR